MHGESPFYGVYGQSTGSGNIGVLGTPNEGVSGIGEGPDNGVYGHANGTGHAGYFSGKVKVTQTLTADGGLVGTASSGAGVTGTSGSGTAVYGSSTSGYAVLGESTNRGVQGTNTSSLNYGALGTANEGVAGVGKGDDEGVYGRAGGTGYAGYFSGKVHVTGTLSKGGGSFRIDHPLDPENRYLQHSFVESPDMMNVYNGNVTTDANGEAVVELPAWFEALNRDFRYQLTVIGAFAQAIVAQEIEDNRFAIRTNLANVKVSWQVTGHPQGPVGRGAPHRRSRRTSRRPSAAPTSTRPSTRPAAGARPGARATARIRHDTPALGELERTRRHSARGSEQTRSRTPAEVPGHAVER